MLDVHAFRCLSLGSIALVLCAGCLTPPCNCAQANSAAAPAPATAAGSAPAAPAAAPAGSQVVWDGDETGAMAKGWADCDKKPDCKAVLGPEPGVGYNNTIGLKMHGEGPGWIGGGWNLFGWWPKDAGIDVSANTHLVLRLKVDAKTAEDAPEIGALGVALKCSNNDKCLSNTATISKYTKDNLLDGQWHEVAIPLGDIKKGEFDAKKVWEIDVNTWSGTPKNFTIFLDDISFQNR